jgi:hypothetical protein
MKGEISGREVGRRENFWGKEKIEKTNNFGQGGWFLVHPQNDFNGLIANWHWWMLVHSSCK